MRRLPVFVSQFLAEISIHAPTWGATIRRRVAALRSRFQSTHPRGVRPVAALQSLIDILFQSTHPRGVRRRFRILCNVTDLFQSTHPRGVRRVCGTKRSDSKNFNPRTHVGCDPLAIRQEACAVNFNPRTHVGCDANFGATFSHDKIFQSTHPRGVRQSGQQERHDNFCISIHAPTWGATVKPSNGWLLGHKDNEFANENIIIINSVNIT